MKKIIDRTGEEKVNSFGSKITIKESMIDADKYLATIKIGGI